MFFDINSYFKSDEVPLGRRDFDIEIEFDNISSALQLKTQVVPLCQTCPPLLQELLEKEEEFRQKIISRYKDMIKKCGETEANKMMKKIFHIWWKDLSNFI